MLNILVVDDSRYQRHVIEQSLTGHGLCTQAADGVEAVERFAAALASGTPFDLVVMDIIMPHKDGHEALREIVDLQERHGVTPDRRARAIMLSSLTDPGSIIQAQFESGADVYITKPFEPSTLIEALVNLGLAESPFPDECDE